MHIVFDLDGTLTHTEHRHHILEEKHASESAKWDAYFDACDKDTPNSEVMALLDSLLSELSLGSYRQRHRIEIWTGRSERTREKTEKWLDTYLQNCRHCAGLKICMRAEGDLRDDRVIKGEWIKFYGKPDLVFDDRNKMVQWWREQGITCLQVKESDF